MEVPVVCKILQTHIHCDSATAAAGALPSCRNSEHSAIRSCTATARSCAGDTRSTCPLKVHCSDITMTHYQRLSPGNLQIPPFTYQKQTQSAAYDNCGKDSIQYNITMIIIRNRTRMLVAHPNNHFCHKLRHCQQGLYLTYQPCTAAQRSLKPKRSLLKPQLEQKQSLVSVDQRRLTRKHKCPWWYRLTLHACQEGNSH
jgi:hypothetical protein